MRVKQTALAVKIIIIVPGGDPILMQYYNSYLIIIIRTIEKINSSRLIDGH